MARKVIEEDGSESPVPYHGPIGRITLEQWIKQVLNDPYKKDPCTLIVLVHKIGTTEKILHKTEVGKNREWTEKTMADLFRDIAQGYCQDIPGVQSFELIAFYGSNEPQAFHPFILSGQLDNHGIGTEGPTEQGRVQQSMRHHEVAFQGMMRERAHILDTALGFMGEMRQANSQLMIEMRQMNRDRFDTIALAERVVLERAQQERETRLAIESSQRRSKIEERLLAVAPALINQITGREILPQATVDTSIIESITESALDASPEDLQQAIHLLKLKPEQTGLLFKRMEEILRKRREDHEAALARRPEAEVDAEDDPVKKAAE